MSPRITIDLREQTPWHLPRGLRGNPCACLPRVSRLAKEEHVCVRRRLVSRRIVFRCRWFDVAARAVTARIDLSVVDVGVYGTEHRAHRTQYNQHYQDDRYHNHIIVGCIHGARYADDVTTSPLGLSVVPSFRRPLPLAAYRYVPRVASTCRPEM